MSFSIAMQTAFVWIIFFKMKVLLGSFMYKELNLLIIFLIMIREGILKASMTHTLHMLYQLSF